jgi:hypothetical protein
MRLINKSIGWVKKKLNKLFCKLFGSKNRIEYIDSVLHAAQENGYVENVSDKADSLHLAIKGLYEEDLKEYYLQIMNALAPFFRRGKVRLAIDIHEKGYYGKKTGIYEIGTSYGNKSYQKAYKYMSISLLTGKKEERIHLYAIPMHIGQDTVQTVAELIKTVNVWFKKIEVVEFDRGFHNKELIDWLEQNRIPYLIHIKKHGNKLENLVEKTKSFYRGRYRKKYNVNKSNFWMETNIYICKNIENKDWLFVSSILFKNKWQVRNLYRNRWQIETNYAINNQNRLMSKSTNYMIRYFYFLCDILLQVLWRLSGLCAMTFKAFLRLFVIGVKKVQEMKPTAIKLPT